ncbi:hypothetical protein JCM18897A_31520 [Streptomyces sp. JCM 18897]
MTGTVKGSPAKRTAPPAPEGQGTASQATPKDCPKPSPASPDCPPEPQPKPHPHPPPSAAGEPHPPDRGK